VNQIPPWAEVQGDIRLTPFYNIIECRKKVERYVADLNSSEYLQHVYIRAEVIITASHQLKFGRLAGLPPISLFKCQG